MKTNGHVYMNLLDPIKIKRMVSLFACLVCLCLKTNLRIYSLENLVIFCRAEAELENYLFTNPMVFQNLNADTTSIMTSNQVNQKSSDSISKIEKSLQETSNKSDASVLYIMSFFF